MWVIVEDVVIMSNRVYGNEGCGPNFQWHDQY